MALYILYYGLVASGHMKAYCMYICAKGNRVRETAVGAKRDQTKIDLKIRGRRSGSQPTAAE